MEAMRGSFALQASLIDGLTLVATGCAQAMIRRHRAVLTARCVLSRRPAPWRLPALTPAAAAARPGTVADASAPAASRRRSPSTGAGAPQRRGRRDGYRAAADSSPGDLDAANPPSIDQPPRQPAETLLRAEGGADHRRARSAARQQRQAAQRRRRIVPAEGRRHAAASAEEARRDAHWRTIRWIAPSEATDSTDRSAGWVSSPATPRCSMRQEPPWKNSTRSADCRPTSSSRSTG